MIDEDIVLNNQSNFRLSESELALLNLVRESLPNVENSKKSTIKLHYLSSINLNSSDLKILENIEFIFNKKKISKYIPFKNKFKVVSKHKWILKKVRKELEEIVISNEY